MHMTRNPVVNAFLVAAYVATVASIMYYGPKFAGPKESVLVPIAVLSLFVLSAAVMGLLFLYQPGQLYLEGNKSQAVNLLLKTLAMFAGITAVLLCLLLFSTFA